MDDLISRQALCEYALNQKDTSVTPNDIMRFPSAQPEEIALHESCTDCPLYDKNRHSCPRFNRVIPETLREAQPEQRWIPCSDDMPKEYGNYLITEMPIRDFEIEPYVATYDPDDDEWTTGSQFRIVRRPVIAWMPLPKSYSERRQDESNRR